MKLTLLLKERAYGSQKRLPKWLKKPISFSKQVWELRKLLGMRQAQLSKRSKLDSRLIRNLEGESVDPRLSTLQKAAQGLGCELLLRFVPKQSLTKMLEERAVQRAKAIVAMSKGTAAMEGQEPDHFLIKMEVENLARELMEKKSSSLWED